jgi:two-component system sensor histidine kinase YesM
VIAGEAITGILEEGAREGSMKWTGQFRNMRLLKVLTLFVLVSIVMLLAALVTFYSFFSSSTLGSAKGLMQTTLTQTGDDIDAQLKDLSNSVLHLAYNKELYEFTQYSPIQKFELSKVIITVLNSLVEKDRLINSVHLQLTNGQRISSSPSPNIYDYMIYNQIVKDYRLMEPFTKTKFTHCYTYPGTANVYFACLVPIYSVTGGSRSEDRYAGAYVAMCTANSLAPQLAQNALDGSALSILEVDGRGPIASNNMALARKLAEGTGGDGEEKILKADKDVYHILSLRLREVDWELQYAQPESRLFKGLVPIRIWSLTLMLAVVIIQSLMGYALHQSIVGPLTDLAAQMHQVGEGGRKHIIPTSRNEIGILTDDINDMLEQMELTSANMLETARALQQSRLDSLQARVMYLQAQINPHFLYNNLECIRGMASAGDVDSLREMIRAMCSIYRYGTRGYQAVRVSDEISMIREFIRIIRLRYQDRYVFSIDADDSLMWRPMPKMTLQPIVENAVLHGYRKNNGQMRLHIRVSAGAGGETVVTVADDGAGMSREKLATLQAALDPAETDDNDETGSIGLKNVNRRIKLLFGDCFGLSVQANAPRGLIVTIRLGETFPASE